MQPKLAASLERPLMLLAARYLMAKRDDGQPLDAVARFHLRNGARLERLNWLGDRSDNGMVQSCGLMVNYRSGVDEIEANHDAPMKDGQNGRTSWRERVCQVVEVVGGADSIKKNKKKCKII